METILNIFLTVLSPIFIQIALGYVLSKRIEIDLKTLTRIQMYILIPALLFSNIYTSQIESGMMVTIMVFTTFLFFILMLIAYIASKIFRFERPREMAFINSVILRNQGNFTIPLIALAYAGSGGDEAMSYHIVVLFTTNLLLNTFGLYNASAGKYTAKEAVYNMMKLPMVYTIAIALFLKGFHIQIPGTLLTTTQILGQGLVAVALLTLGAQLANTKIAFRDLSVYVSNIGRLLVSPAIAWAMVLIMGYDGILGQVLVIGAAAPTAVNSVLLAIEFDGDAPYASQTVLMSTLLSAITVSVVVSLVRLYI